MGLDQYAFAVPCDDAKGLPDVEAKMPDTAEKVWQWRKHANLHGWMEHLYRTRGGGGDFNCQTVRLALHDLDQLELDIISHALPYTEGFFLVSPRQRMTPTRWRSSRLRGSASKTTASSTTTHGGDSCHPNHSPRKRAFFFHQPLERSNHDCKETHQHAIDRTR